MIDAEIRKALEGHLLEGEAILTVNSRKQDSKILRTVLQSRLPHNPQSYSTALYIRGAPS